MCKAHGLARELEGDLVVTYDAGQTHESDAFPFRLQYCVVLAARKHRGGTNDCSTSQINLGIRSQAK